MATIITKNSSTASSVPTNAQLVQGELAVNVTDKRLFTENASGTVVELGTNPSSLALPNGSVNGVPYLNASKELTTGSALTFDGTNLGVGTASPVFSNSGTGLMVNGTTAGTVRVTQGGGTQAGEFRADANNITIGSRTNGSLIFEQFGSERARIDSSGNLLVGTTSAAQNIANGFNILNASAGTQIDIGHSNGTGSGTSYATFAYNSGNIGSITQNGTTGVLYNLTSDYRLKNNPTALTGSGAFIDALQPKTWDWLDGSGKGVGFIAHEFMEVAKYSGNGEKDAVDADGKPVYQSIQPSSSEVMANLVAEIQSLRKRLAALESK